MSLPPCTCIIAKSLVIIFGIFCGELKNIIALIAASDRKFLSEQTVQLGIFFRSLNEEGQHDMRIAYCCSSGSLLHLCTVER